MPKTLIFYLLIGLHFLVFSSCSDAQNKTIPHKVELYKPKNKDVFIDNFVNELHQKYAFNGNVLIAKKGKVIYQKSIGWANYLTKDSLRIDDQFQLASISKTFTGVAILQLIAKGKLHLQDTVTQFFPKFPYKNISIKSLLTHRSGLVNYVYFTDKYWKNKDQGMSNKDAIDLMIKYKPNPYSKPNTRFQYNNTNFMLLGAIIEQVTGGTLAAYMQKNIFEVAGMKHTNIYTTLAGAKIPVRVIGHDRGNFRYSVRPNFLDGTVGDKGVYSTVTDLFLYHEALEHNKLLPQKWLDSAYTGYSKPMHGKFNYGYGWRIFDGDQQHKVVYHTGWWHGFKSILLRDLKQDIVVVFLGNLSNASLQHLDKLYLHLQMPVIKQGAYDANGVYQPSLNGEEEE